jgi:hypothetical protein
VNLVSQVGQYKVLHIRIELFIISDTFTSDTFTFGFELSGTSTFLRGSPKDSLVDDTVQALLLATCTASLRRLRMLRRFDFGVGGEVAFDLASTAVETNQFGIATTSLPSGCFDARVRHEVRHGDTGSNVREPITKKYRTN